MPVFQYLGGAYGRGLLESALAEPAQTFEGRWLHRNIFDKAAALFRSIIKNHPLLDGNKRLALTALTVFLGLNGYLLYVPRDEAVAFSLRVASHEGDFDSKIISSWVRRHSVSLSSDHLSDKEQEKYGLILVQAAPFQIKALDGMTKVYRERGQWFVA